MIKVFIGGTISFLLASFLYPHFIKFLQENNFQQKPSEYALEEYKEKSKTVTFGGFIFLIVPIIVTVFLLNRYLDRNTVLILLVFLGYGLIGLVDDYKIVKEGKNDGLSAKMKFALQLILAVVFYVLYLKFGGDNLLTVPFKKTPIDLSYLYFVMVLFILTGSSNAVNLTDGMDGLASGTVIIALLPFAYFAYQQAEMGLFFFVISLIASLFAFLRFNKSPAKIFMGDVGSLALGAVLGVLSILLRKELLFVIIGGVFVFETVTVIMQQISWRTRRKRIFKYTPIHYSFTLNGWKEKDVVLLFYALGLTFALIGLGLSALS
ncbi:MAG TPA: phospho-N-acetylmuramoyl-pentapeptide-transferase [Erysipelothrix sp.]